MGLIDKLFRINKKSEITSAETISTAKDFKKIIFDSLKDYLKPLGYKKQNTSFVLDDSELVYYIQVQSSKYSTSKIAELTINLGILSKEILRKEGYKPDIGHCQWRHRIGFFLDKPNDKWWTIDSTNKAKDTSAEIIGLIENNIFKEWAKIKTNNDLKKIWETGQCTGITEGQRLHYLKELEK